MTDREKTINGLEKLREDLGYGLPDRSNVVMEYLNSLTDAIALLKDQEAIPPVRENDGELGEVAQWWYVCGVCKRGMDYHDKFCRWCGRPVKWE